MTLLTPDSPKEDVLSYLDSSSNAIIAALTLALEETKRIFHSLGTPLDPEEPYDKSYFSHTMRYIARRELREHGVQVLIEDEAEAGYQVGQAANTGIVLEIPGVFARVLKSPLDEELPPAGSEARAYFYEQRQYTLPFPPLEGEVSLASEAEEIEDSNALHLVYAWDVNPSLEYVLLKLACPRARSGECHWQHIFPDRKTGGSGGSPVWTPPTTPTPIATAAAAANTNLDISPKTNEDDKKQVKPGAAKRA